MDMKIVLKNGISLFYSVENILNIEFINITQQEIEARAENARLLHLLKQDNLELKRKVMRYEKITNDVDK